MAGHVGHPVQGQVMWFARITGYVCRAKGKESATLTLNLFPDSEFFRVKSPNLHTILPLKTISGTQKFMKYFVTRYCIIRPGQRDSSIEKNTGYIGLRAVSTGIQVPLLAKLSILNMLIVGFTNPAKLVWYLTPTPNLFRLGIWTDI